MSVRPILVLPDARLRAVADPIDRIDDEVKKLAKDMLETMYAAPRSASRRRRSVR